MKKTFILFFLFISFIGYSQDSIRLVYSLVETMPEPVNGKYALTKWVDIKSTELKEKYQIDCEKKELKQIFIIFEIDTSGNLINPMLIEGIAKSIDNEALELVRTMDLEWKPGINIGQKVVVQMRLKFILCPGTF